MTTDGAVPRLRIQPELNLDYPRTDISEISLDEATGGYSITTTFFGLYGVSSPLPGFYTEELLDDEWDDFTGRKTFFDVIHNHIYPLLYQAWLKYKFSHNVVEFDNHLYTEIIFSLIGLDESLRDDRVHYGYLFKYSGLLSQKTKSLSGLKTLLQDYLGDIGLDINPCVERKAPITESQYCLVGEQASTLGSDVSIGEEISDRNGKFNLDIGPLNSEQFIEFSQGGDRIKTLQGLIKLYLVQPLLYSITLLAGPGVIDFAALGNKDNTILGVNCWLTGSANDAVTRIAFNDTVY